jgi:tRNA(fMet)-specific endonuclease VapC
MIILDTDHLTLVQQEDSAEGLRIRARVAQRMPQDFPVTTVITYEEQMRGWMAAMSKSRKTSEQIQVYRRLMLHIENYRKIRVILYDELAAARLEQLRAHRIRVGTMDLKIAAITLSQNALLLSRNVQDFSRVPGLHVEDWTKP